MILVHWVNRTVERAVAGSKDLQPFAKFVELQLIYQRNLGDSGGHVGGT